MPYAPHIKRIADSVQGRSASDSDFLGVTVQIRWSRPKVTSLDPSIRRYRFTVRASASFRQRRAVGGSVQRSRRGAPAPQHHPRQADDGTHRKILAALKGVRGREPVDLAALELLVVRFSYLITEQVWIKEVDINPLLASPDGLLGFRFSASCSNLPTSGVPPRAAIRPYPSQYVQPWTFPDGVEVLIRPIRPEDEPMIARFHERLSERSVYLRVFSFDGPGPACLARSFDSYLL